ncbi:hypothetical protein [Klebsiella quasipneumoniae]|uniref:hypothetical protein n=1 Tax=Klebsiella quasipneumoniae TaxID=1463165 RepID=UPI00191D114E|nr:hypothetical protein [Klebsiella quasipneumoniae]
MNGIDIVWALLTLLSVVLFISGDWLAQRKIRLLNYVLLAALFIYLADVFQTIQNLGKMGYLFRMLTWTIQASFISLSLYRVWNRPWFARCSAGARAMGIVFAAALVSCLMLLVL